MRVLLTCDPLLPVPPRGYGGIERIVDSLVTEFRQRGHQVALLAKIGSTCSAHARFDWPADDIRGRISTLRNGLAVRRAVRQFQPDVVHSFARLAYLLPILRQPIPKIMSYQRQVGPRQVTPSLRLARRDTLQFTGCSAFICEQGRRGGGRWTTIHNFVDLTKIDFAPSVASDAPLLFLSRVESIKGPDLAIEIARRCGRPLIIAGNHATRGSEGDFWRQRIAPALGRDGIEYVGEVGDDAKRRLLAGAAALLVPIQWDEPFGIVFAEALAAGTPVITCARGALPEIVTSGINGYFIREVAEGVEAVSHLPALSRQACRHTAEARFSVQISADAYLQLYQKATEDGKP